MPAKSSLTHHPTSVQTRFIAKKSSWLAAVNSLTKAGTGPERKD